MGELQNAVEGTDPLLGGTGQILRNMRPCRLVERDGRVVGCWFAASCAVAASNGPEGDSKRVRVNVIGAMRTADGRAVGFNGMHDLDDGLALWALDGLSEAARAPAGDGRLMADEAFVSAVDAIVRFVARSEDQGGGAPFAAAVHGSLRDLLGWEPGKGDVDAAVRSWASDAKRRMMVFLRTLDPWALQLLVRRRDLHGLMGTAWPGLDRTFEPDAPLRTALLANPDRAPHVLRSWPSEAAKLREALRAGAVKDWLDGVVVDSAQVPAHLLPELDDVERSLPGAGAGEGCGGSATGRDAAALVRRVDRLAAAHRPKGADEWHAFRRLLPVYDELAGWDAYVDPVGLLLGTGADWAGRSRAVADAFGSDDFQAAAGMLDTMATAFARQVLMPGVAIARGRAPDVGRHTWEAWSNAAHTILLSARSLPDMLRVAGEWSSNIGFADGPGSMPGPGPDARWPAHVPDWRTHRVRINVVRDWPSLKGEVRRLHPGRSGLAHHEALRLFDACVTGRARVLRVSLTDEGGATDAVSVAEISLETSPFSVTSLRAPQGRAARTDLTGAVARYLRHLRMHPAASGVGGRTSLRSASSVGSLCGYDWRDQERWHAAVRSWDPLTTAALRSVQPWQVARLVGTHMRPGRPRWEGHLKVEAAHPGPGDRFMTREDDRRREASFAPQP